MKKMNKKETAAFMGMVAKDIAGRFEAKIADMPIYKVTPDVKAVKEAIFYDKVKAAVYKELQDTVDAKIAAGEEVLPWDMLPTAEHYDEYRDVVYVSDEEAAEWISASKKANEEAFLKEYKYMRPVFRDIYTLAVFGKKGMSFKEVMQQYSQDVDRAWTYMQELGGIIQFYMEYIRPDLNLHCKDIYF